MQMKAAGFCEDGKQNGKESDVDCGGPDCPKCGVRRRCLDSKDCKVGRNHCAVLLSPVPPSSPVPASHATKG